MSSKLKGDDDLYTFESGKTYTHAQGLSCCFRQWRADSHCKYLHGYSLQVTVTFRSLELDDRNWVMDFGSLKPLKTWLELMFDHKTLIAKDDPHIDFFKSQEFRAVGDLQLVDHVGCEAFAKMISDWLDDYLLRIVGTLDIWVECVEVREHEGNFARYRRHHNE